MKKLNKKGFTLIEIIVVIVVLAVLMAVSVPSVLKYINEADNAKYMAQGRSVMTIAQTEVIKAYVGDNIITSSEVTNIHNVNTYSPNEDGMGDITRVVVYMKDDANPFTVTENSGTLKITGGKKLDTNTTESEVAGVYCEINGKIIVAVPNGKIYVSK